MSNCYLIILLLHSVVQQLINCTKEINDKIDQVLAVVEEKRKLLLDKMAHSINNKKTQIETIQNTIK